MKHFFFGLVVLFSSVSCNEESGSLQPELEWKKLYNVGKHISFCYLDSLSNSYVLAYTSSSQNKCAVVEFGENLESKVIFEKAGESITGVQFNDNFICMIKRDTDFNFQLLCRRDTGNTWDQVRLVNFNPRKFANWNSVLVVDGRASEPVASNFIESRDSGRTWSHIGILPNYKNLIIEETFNEFVLCKGNKEFNRNEFLVLLDLKRNVLIDLMEMDHKNYINVISPRNDEFGIEYNGVLTIYSMSDGIHKKEKEIELPIKLLSIENFYYNESFSVVTARDQELEGKTRSWIKESGKRTWQPFNQNKGFKLVENNISTLAVVDDDGNVLVAK